MNFSGRSRNKMNTGENSPRNYDHTSLKISLALLLFVSPLRANENHTLAPHPFYFTVDGSPAYVERIVNGKVYIFGWDGKQPFLIEKVGGDVPFKGVRFGKPPTDFNKHLGWVGCFVPIIFGGLFWIGLIALFWWLK